MMGGTGFSLPEIDRIIVEAEIEDEADEAVPQADRRDAPVSRGGDIWLLDEHRLLSGDARDPAAFAALLGDERAAVGLHDPPYNVSVTKHVSRSGRHGDFIFASGELSEEAFTGFLTDFFIQSRAHSRPGAVQFCFMDWRHMGELLKAGRRPRSTTAQQCAARQVRPQ
jgi:hypothetical protein